MALSNLRPVIVAVCVASVVATIPVGTGARADTIYHCGFRDGVAFYTINTKPRGAKCTVYQTDRSEPKPGQKGVRCRAHRYRESVFYGCERNGIWWWFNKEQARRASSGALPESGGKGPSNAVTEGQGDEEDSPEARPSRKGGESLDAIIARAAAEAGIPEALLRAVITQESGFNPDVVSPAGAQGLMQLMPVTARSLDVDDPFDPEQNVLAGARFLRKLSDRFHGDIERTIAAYYAGPTAVAREGGVPVRCEGYVRSVLKHYRRFAGNPH